MEETKNINEQYLAAIKHNVEAAQETGDIPSDFVFSFNVSNGAKAFNEPA